MGGMLRLLRNNFRWFLQLLLHKIFKNPCALPIMPNDVGSLPTKSFSVAIVGGGLAGLSLARGLTRHGIRCQVFESAPVFAAVGAGLSFAVNSIEALKLVDPASHQKFLERCDDISEKKDVYMTYRDGRTDEAEIITTLYCRGSGQQAVHRTLLVKVSCEHAYQESTD